MQTLPANKYSKFITNDQLNIAEKRKGNENCKKRKIINAAQCSKHKVLYIKHTGERLSECFFILYRNDLKRVNLQNIFNKVTI